jgi:hypothetical protein
VKTLKEPSQQVCIVQPKAALVQKYFNSHANPRKEDMVLVTDKHSQLYNATVLDVVGTSCLVKLEEPHDAGDWADEYLDVDPFANRQEDLQPQTEGQDEEASSSSSTTENSSHEGYDLTNTTDEEETEELEEQGEEDKQDDEDGDDTLARISPSEAQRSKKRRRGKRLTKGRTEMSKRQSTVDSPPSSPHRLAAVGAHSSSPPAEEERARNAAAVESAAETAAAEDTARIAAERERERERARKAAVAEAAAETAVAEEGLQTLAVQRPWCELTPDEEAH